MFTAPLPTETARQKILLSDSKMIAAAAAALCCLIGGGVWLAGGESGDDSATLDGNVAGSGDPKSKTDELKLVSVPRTEIDEGKPLRLTLHLEGDSVSRSGVTFRIDGESPEGFALDAKTGELSWNPSEKTAPANSM